LLLPQIESYTIKGVPSLQSVTYRVAVRKIKKLAVISAVGTRGYYADRDFKLETRYMVKDL
jgi:histone acetyltransferase (RNA polymerase elongator complex component)